LLKLSKHLEEEVAVPRLARFQSFLRNLFFPRSVEVDLDREVHSHLEMLTEENIRAGMQPKEAQRAARLELGGVEQVKEQVREERVGNWLRSVISDCRCGVRQLQKNPGFTTVTVLTLALGVGANTAMFSMVYGVVLRPLPFKDAGHLYTLWERNTKMGYEQNPPAAGNFRDWRDRNRVFEGMAAFDASRTFNLAGNSSPERVDGAAISPELFELLGVSPVIGRGFSPQDDQLGQNRVVVLSYRLWQRRFNSNPSIVGTSITLDGSNSTVIGVMPPGFHFPGDTGTVLNIFTAPPAQLWVPLALTPKAWSARSSHYLEVIGRLRSGVTVDQAQTEMNSIEDQLVKEYPRDYIGSDVNLVPLHTQIVGTFRSALLVLFGAVAFVLLIVCANVANLLLARATSRRREIAIRTALGASRSRLVRQLATESLTLAIVGGALGVLIAAWGVTMLKLIVPDNFPRTADIHLDGPALIFTAIASVSTGLIFGLAPAFQTSRTDVTESLKEGGRGVEGIGRDRLRSALVISEVALALILLVGTGLMLRSFLRLQQVDPGFKPDHLLTMEISLPRYSAAQKTSFYSQLLERVRALLEVQSAGAIGHLPLGGNIDSYNLEVLGRAPLRNEYANPSCHVIMSGYFESMKIPLREGRYFDARDNADSPHVLIINDVVARNVFPTVTPIGQRLQLGLNGFTGEIVGVVGHTSHLALDYAPVEEVYMPYPQVPFSDTMALTIRTASAPLALSRPVQDLIRALDKDRPVSKIRTMDDVMGTSAAAPRFRTVLLGLFGLAALLLGGLGIYGVISYSVSQRTREFGIRVALGADLGQILRSVIAHGLKLTLAGVLIGVAGGLVLTRFLRSLLFGISAADPLTFASVALLLTVVAVLACYIPARRAIKVDPVIALRYE
jgi:putative ABC transport system permease protein